MVQTRSSTRNSLDSEENNTTQGNGPQHAKTEEKPGLSELTTGRRPIKRKYSDDDPDADEEKPQKRKRIPRGGQRKTHVFHIPVPDPQDLKVIRRNFKRPQNRQVWGVIRDHFSALEDLWIKKYEWNMPTTRTELDYGLLVRNIYKYRHIPSSNGRTCDRCSARGQTGCLHNGVDRCKGCVRNGVQCTVTNKRSGQTRILQGNLNANEPVSDPGAMVTWCTPDQQPPLPKGPAKKHRSDAGIDDEVKERRVANAGPSTQVPQQDFVGRARGNPTMRNSQQLPVQQQNPTTFFENGSYTNNPFSDPQLYPDDTSFETQQGLPFGGQYQMHPEYPMPPDSTGFNLHFPQYDQGSNGVGLQPQFSQLDHGRPFIHDREIMMNAIIELRAEVQRLGGNTSIAADLVALAPIQRAPATLQGPAPFPSRRQSQSANTATASHSNPVTPTSPLFESALEDVTPTSSAFDYKTQHQSPGSGFLDTKVHRQSPASAGFEHNIHNQTDTSSLFNSAAHNPGPTSAPSHNNMSHQGPAQPLFSSEFELPPEFTGFPSNFQQFGQQPSETPIDPSLLEYPNFLQLNTENASNRSRLETYDANGEVIPALKQEGTARMSRLSAAAHPELSGNGDETEIEARDTSLRSTKERLRGHAEEVLLEEEQGSPHIPLDKGWPADGPVQFGNMNANDDNDVQPVLDDDLPNDSLIIEQFDGFIALF